MAENALCLCDGDLLKLLGGERIADHFGHLKPRRVSENARPLSAITSWPASASPPRPQSGRTGAPWGKIVA